MPIIGIFILRNIRMAPMSVKAVEKSLEHGQMSVPLIILFRENTEVQII